MYERRVVLCLLVFGFIFAISSSYASARIIPKRTGKGTEADTTKETAEDDNEIEEKAVETIKKQSGIKKHVVEEKVIEKKPLENKHSVDRPKSIPKIKVDEEEPTEPEAETQQETKRLPTKQDEGSNFKLSKHPSCAEDVSQLCSSIPKENNFAVLVCLQDAAKQEDDQVNDDCHQLVWEYKQNLTSSIMFDKAAFEVCESSLVELNDCKKEFPPDGSLVNCLVEHRELIKNQKCRNFLNKMAAIVFSDYRLIKAFYKECHGDVSKHSCGKIGSSSTDPHTQAEVIECLEDHVTELKEECQVQIKRVAELSSNDYHTDRALFYACESARERFCVDVQAGEGRVYKCLMDHKFEETMSDDCKDKLTVRQKLAQEDVKVNHPLWEQCQKDFNTYKCKQGETEHGQTSHLILCLNQAVADGKEINPKCHAELHDAASQLFADYKLSPEIVAHCDKELEAKCKSEMKAEGGALDCLMGLGEELNEKCYKAVHDVLKETDAGSDFKIDRPLNFKCQSFIASVCKGKPESQILSCLMDNIRSEGIPPDCQKELFHLQFFLARDFSLDTDLYRDCKDDAKKLCSAPDFSEDLLSIPPGMVIACLYRASSHDISEEHRVSATCGAHVKRVMHLRSTSVNLMPEIEEPCRADISKFCLDQHSKEIECLQGKYEDLAHACKESIANFTEMESEDVEMDQDLINACAPMVIKFCQDVVQQGNSEGVLPCLIENKHNEGMNLKCAASIEHWQILELKDVRFNHNLKKACSNEIMQFCSTSADKVAAVHCLSGAVKDSVVKQGRKVSAECQEEIRKELITEHEDIRLNPELEISCKDDLAMFCSDVWHVDKTEGQAKAETCLREKKKSLSKTCYDHLFLVELEEVADPSLDYDLVHICKPMIKKYCMSSDPKKYLECLRSHKNDIEMTPECRKVIFQRQKEGAEEFLLDPDIGEFCKPDVQKFCGDIKEDKRGKIMLCLKKVMQENRLSEDCENFVRLRQEESALDYRLDPVLEEVCIDEVHRLCSDSSPGHGNVVDCLKENYKNIKGKACKAEIKRIIAEGVEDVHSDPHLMQECALDITNFCEHVIQKEGKVIECLLEVYNSKNLHLKKHCKRVVKKRMQLWNVAEVTVKYESLSDIAAGVHASPNRHYFYTATMCILAVIFVGGLCFGRVTKRVKQEFKDR